MKTISIALIMLAATLSQASTTFKCDGKEVTKGQAASLLQAKKAKCVKVQDIEFNAEKFSIVNTKAVKK